MAQRGQTFGGDFQIRQAEGSPSPGTIAGPVIVYGDVAPNPYGGLGPERMLPGAWGPDIDRQSWTANLMHNRRQQVGATGDGLTILDSDTALLAEIILPDSELGRETAYLARQGKISGLSGEFDILQQYLAADGVRNVARVAGDAIGLVDNPAYRQSTLNIRQAQSASVIIAGPAGAGKTQRARVLMAALAAAGYQPFAADFQSILAALLLLERLPDGRYPERLDDQAYAIAMVESLRTSLVRFAIEDDRPVIATISEKPGSTRYTSLLALFGGQARQETVDPGIRVIVERLTLPGATEPSRQCADAADRYYGLGSIREYIDNRTATRRRNRRQAAL